MEEPATRRRVAVLAVVGQAIKCTFTTLFYQTDHQFYQVGNGLDCMLDYICRAAPIFPRFSEVFAFF
jgi:hypothetical protein